MNMEYYMAPEEKVAVGIKIFNHLILKCRVYPGLSMWTLCRSQSLIKCGRGRKEKRSEQCENSATIAGFEDGETGMKKRMLWSLEAVKCKKGRFSLEASERKTAHLTPWCVGKPMSDFWPLEWEDNKPVVLSHCVYGNLLQQAHKNNTLTWL